MKKIYLTQVKENKTGLAKNPNNFYTLKSYIQVNFLGWGFYKAVKVDKSTYHIFDKFDNTLQYIVFEK